MSKLYWLLNIGLAGLAVAVAAWVLGQQPQKRWEARAAHTAAPVPLGKTAQERSASSLSRHLVPAPDAFDSLWQESLFRPERSEEVSASDTGEGGDAAAPESAEFELQGIGVIGTEAAAIIVDKLRRTVPRPRPGPGGQPQVETVRTQHVYKVNAEIGTTGYKVKEVRKTEVVLARGDEERILKLESGDQDSQGRRARAAEA